jgi:hypothetical protein
MTLTTGYRFKVPSAPTACGSTSFGIEPYGVNSKGKTVKTGKALVRVAMWNDYRHARTVAQEAALVISDHLNKGGTYTGPKTINIDAVFSVDKLQGWLK